MDSRFFTGHPVQAGPDALHLEPRFLFVVQMMEVTAAAELRHGAGPVDAVGGFFDDLDDLTGGPGLLGLLNADLADLPGDGVGDEDGAALDLCNALAFTGVVHDLGGINLVFGQHS